MTADAVGGVWTYALDLVRALPEVEFTVATMGRRPSADQTADLPPNLTLCVGDFRLEWEEEPWEDVRRAGDWLLDLERGTRPDVVHLNGLRPRRAPFPRTGAVGVPLGRPLLVAGGEGRGRARRVGLLRG